jgi:Conjugative transposon protein TcpC
MVRRAILDRGAQSDAYAAGVEAAPGVPGSADQRADRTPSPWRGSGGRWLVWAFRAVAWAVLLVIGYRGVTAIVLPPRQASPVAGPAAAGSAHGFPVRMAEAYAQQFAEVYLNFTPATAAVRAQQLAVFLPPGSDSQLGWNGQGSLQLQSEQVAGITVRDSQHAIVTLLVRASGNLMELGVPVYAADGGLAISAEPSLLPPPPRVAPPGTPSAASDPATAATLGRQLPAFFRAYASGDPVTLGRFLARGATVTGLGGTVTYGTISGIEVPPGGSTRHIMVSVIWRLAGQAAAPSQAPARSPVTTGPAGLEMTYRMTVIQQGGSWYVAAIGSSSQPLAPP